MVIEYQLIWGAVSNATVTILKTVVGHQVMTQLVTTWNKLAVGF